MSLLIAWLLFPALLGLIALGCGLLVERVAGTRVPGLLLLPLGLALVVVVSQLATNWGATAELATPVMIVLSLAGYALSRTRLRVFRPDWWAVAAVLSVFAVFAAPVVLSGQATFAGYNLNGEPSIHFIGIDRLMGHGRSVAGLPPSSYQVCLQGFFGNGYPSGAQTALGGARPLAGQDVAWLYQPYLAFLVAMASLALYAIVSPLVRRPLHRAVVVFLAAQPALMYAYSLQGSLKELATVWIVTLLVALVVEFVKEPGRLRSVVPLAVASAASLGVINIAVAPWLVPILLACLGLALRLRPRAQWRLTAKQAAVFIALTAVLAYPALSVADDLYKSANDQLTAQSDITAARGLGNLLGPLHKVQVMGIWLSGDYRATPTGSHHDVTYALLAIAFLAALIGLGWAVRRRSVGPLLYIGVSALAGAYVVRRGSPWADGKALMIMSPAALLAIMLGPAALGAKGGAARTVAAGVLAAALALGVLWSNALAYHEVNLAPRDRLLELEKLGKEIAGQGPTVYFEYEEYAKHFLRNAAPEGRTEACQGRFSKMRNGQLPMQGFTADPDQQTLHYLLHFRTIVLRRSPAISRPPALYARVHTTPHYEVWQRPARPDMRVLAHFPLGDLIDQSSRARCADVMRLAEEARRARARIAFVRRDAPIVWIPALSGELPRGWFKDPVEGHILIPNGAGKMAHWVRVRSRGPYTLWLGGSFGRGYRVFVDGTEVGRVRYALNGRDQYERVTELTLSEGRHLVRLERGGGDLHPGNGGLIRSLGPVELQDREASRRLVEYIDPARARSLCGRELDWIEVVRA